MAARIVQSPPRDWQGQLCRALGLLTAVVLATACQPSESVTAEPEVMRIPITLTQVQRGDVEITSEVVGTLTPWRRVQVAAEVTGTISALEVDMGDTVDEGETLLRLDMTDAELAVEEAEAAISSAQATMSEAEANHERIASIAESGVATQSDLDSVFRVLAVARAAEHRARVNLSQAREVLADCTVTSPIGGVVTRRLVEIGETIAAGTPAIEVADLRQVKFVSEISARERVSLTVGQPVRITVDALGGEVFTGTIHALGSNADRETLTFPLEIAIPNPDGRLLGGMIARATLLLEERPGSLLLPLEARVVRIDAQGVFTVTGAESGSPEVHFVDVEFGDRHGDVIEVLRGLEEGTHVVGRGSDGLRDGVAVRIAEGG